jgi:hypothetical protein
VKMGLVVSENCENAGENFHSEEPVKIIFHNLSVTL